LANRAVEHLNSGTGENARLRSTVQLSIEEGVEGFGDVRKDRQIPGPKGNPALFVTLERQATSVFT